MATKQQIRKAAEEDLLTFIKLVAPHRVLGACHEELVRWWQREGHKDNQLVLLPRDHQKSALIAYRVAWWITQHPDTTVLYVSATADLAEKQLKFIKDIFTSDVYQYYWPEMVDKHENKRERWSVSEISVDHPLRKAEGVRDATIKAVGLTANTTGLHCKVAVLDDIVVPGNAYTEIGREQVRAFYSQLSSIETTDAKEWAVGTRYHPADIYRDLIDMEEFVDEEGDGENVYEVWERQVETNGEFLWPRQRRHDGKMFGFDERILARKKAKYLDVTQFYAQYYNNPNSPDNQLIDRNKFQHYEKSKLVKDSGTWYYNDKPLWVFAGMDFAFSLSEVADYTTIVVVGVDQDGYIYVLDLERFRTNKISEMYKRMESLYTKWGFRRVRCEVTAAQSLIVEQFQDQIRQGGLALSIDKFRPVGSMGNKEERIQAALEPRYENGTIFHYKGGYCSLLEEELVLAKPEHDDLKDALASVVEIAKAPMRRKQRVESNVIYSQRFGGVAFTG